MKQLSKTILFCLAAAPLFAQTNKERSLQDIQREMMEMQRQLLQQFQHISPDNPAFSMPEWKWDTSFSFKIDTLFGDQGTGFNKHFFFSPFGKDSSAMSDFWKNNPFSENFRPFGDDFDWFFPPNSGAPKNEENSALSDPGDGLLPEERLRKESDEEKKPAEKHKAPESGKSKIKTIRI